MSTKDKMEQLREIYLYDFDKNIEKILSAVNDIKDIVKLLQGLNSAIQKESSKK